MANNSIGSRRGSVRGAPPQVYVPFGTYGADDEHIRAAVKFFADWLRIAAFFVLIMFAIAVYVILFRDSE